MIPRRIAFLALPALALSFACGGGGTNVTGASAGTGAGEGTSSSAGAGASTSSGNASSSGTGGGSSSSSSASSGGTGGGSSTCTWSKTNPCGSGHYCDATACGSGTCVPVGAAETPDKNPVCGCDGVTYWNASVAASHGMAVAKDGACAQGVTCGGIANLQCPAGASCNFEVPTKAGCGIADNAGTCWAVPATCVQGIGFGPNTRACASLSCTDECDLIKLMVPWYVDNTCPQ